MIVISVDPGLTGACAVLDHNGLRAVFDLPVMQDPSVGPSAKVQNKVDARALVKLLRHHCPAGEPVRAVLERIASTGPENKHSIQTQVALIGTFRAVEAVLECLGWAPDYAHPQTWKRHYGLLDSKLTPTQRKRKSLECARRLYPGRAELERARDHNRGDAVLIGHWYREKQA